MNERKRSLKGTTLIEVIISLAVFAMLGVILVQVGTVIDRMNKATNRLNKRVNIQAPYAAAQKTSYEEYSTDESGHVVSNTVQLEENDMTIVFSLDDAGGNPKTVDVKVKKSVDSDEYETRSITARVELAAKSYSTKKIVENNTFVYRDNEANRNHHLQFAVLDDSELTLTPIVFDFSVDPTTSVDITNYYGYTLPTGMTWRSVDLADESLSGDSVATVNNGRITAVGNGDCKIIGETSTHFIYVIYVSVMNKP